MLFFLFMYLLLILISTKDSINPIKVINTIANLLLEKQLHEDHLVHYKKFLLELSKNQEINDNNPASGIGRAYFTFYKAVTDMLN